MNSHQKFQVEKLGQIGLDAIANGYTLPAAWHMWAYEHTPQRNRLMEPFHDTMRDAGNGMDRIECRYPDYPVEEGLTVDVRAYKAFEAEYRKAEVALEELEKSFILEHVKEFMAKV